MDIIIKEFSKKLNQNLNGYINKIIIFGSRARGDFDENSDYDFAIIVNDRFKDLRKIIAKAEADISIKYNSWVSSLIFSKKEWEDKKHHPICKRIIDEGIPVWMKKHCL